MPSEEILSNRPNRTEMSQNNPNREPEGPNRTEINYPLIQFMIVFSPTKVRHVKRTQKAFPKPELSRNHLVIQIISQLFLEFSSILTLINMFQLLVSSLFILESS